MKTHLEVVRILGIILVDLLAEQGDWISDKQVSQMTSQLLVHTWGVMSRIRWSLNIVGQVCESHYMQRHDECTIHIIRILLLEMYTAWLCGDRKWDRWVKYGFTITTHTNTHYLQQEGCQGCPGPWSNQCRCNKRCMETDSCQWNRSETCWSEIYLLSEARTREKITQITTTI